MLTKLQSQLFSHLHAFFADQRGVTAIEYAIIGVIISAMVLAVFVTDNDLQTAFSGAMSAISSNIAAAQPSN
ncbi:Flp family type IVb pilin [Vibrio sinaloensis]|nr:Flp family type IVb pilin [Vibrio sinaloensis]